MTTSRLTKLLDCVTPQDAGICQEIGELLLANQPTSWEAILWFGHAAILGDPDARFRLAIDCHLRDIKEIGRLHLTAAEKGSHAAEAKRLMHQWHLEVLDREAGVYEWHHRPDEPEKLTYLRECIFPTDADSFVRLGDALLQAHMPYAKAEAVEWLVAGAILSNEDASFRVYRLWKELGNEAFAAYHLRVAADRGHNEAYDLLEAEAEEKEVDEADDGEGQYQAAVECREAGSREEAIENLRLAAAVGYEAAHELLAEWKVEGFCEFDSEEEARRLLLASARFGNEGATVQLAKRLRPGEPLTLAEALFAIAGFYDAGTDGFERNDEEAAEWYDRAVAHNYIPALLRLAEIHLPAEKGWNYLERAAKAGDVPSMRRMAAAIESGEEPDSAGLDSLTRAGIAQSWNQMAGDPSPFESVVMEETTATALVAAAVSGDSASQFSLAMWHYSGYEVQQSYPLCYFWGKVLAKTSLQQASGILPMVTPSVTSGMRRKMDLLARVWTPGTPPPVLK